MHLEDYRFIGLIDGRRAGDLGTDRADTYIRLTEAIIAGSADAAAFQPTLSESSPPHSPAGRDALAATAIRLRAVSLRLRE